MARALRFGSTLSFIALASLTAGCAAPQSHVRTAGFGGKANGQVGLATRALAALNSNNVPAAIQFAEQAVEKTPNDAGFRALLGSAYFAGGRFKSAEAAYKDALSIYSNQPQVVLKLALVEIAQGKNAEALSYLEAGRDVLDASDYGLAVALAGQPERAIGVLQSAARAPDADARVRQNLALAYALAGDWTNAKTVAAQDIPGDQLDARIHQWMQIATPGNQSTAIATLIGVTSGRCGSGPADALGAEQDEHADGSVCSSAGSSSGAHAAAAGRRGGLAAGTGCRCARAAAGRACGSRSGCGADALRQRAGKEVCEDRRCSREEAERCSGEERRDAQCLGTEEGCSSPHGHHEWPLNGRRPARCVQQSQERSCRLEHQGAQVPVTSVLHPDERAFRELEGDLLPPVGEGLRQRQ